MSDEIKYAAAIILSGLTWVGRLVWVNHIAVQNIKATHPTWPEMKKEMQLCSDQKDSAIKELKEDLTYIRSKIDMLINREMDK